MGIGRKHIFSRPYPWTWVTVSIDYPLLGTLELLRNCRHSVLRERDVVHVQYQTIKSSGASTGLGPGSVPVGTGSNRRSHAGTLPANWHADQHHREMAD